MNAFVIFAAALACATADLVAHPGVDLVQAPASATLTGPDGSSISTHQPGGALVHHHLQPALALHPGHMAPAHLATDHLMRAGAYAPAMSMMWGNGAHWASPINHWGGGQWAGHAAGKTVISGPSGTIEATEPWMHHNMMMW